MAAARPCREGRSTMPAPHHGRRGASRHAAPALGPAHGAPYPMPLPTITGPSLLGHGAWSTGRRTMRDALSSPCPPLSHSGAAGR